MSNPIITKAAPMSPSPAATSTAIYHPVGITVLTGLTGYIRY